MCRQQQQKEQLLVHPQVHQIYWSSQVQVDLQVMRQQPQQESEGEIA
jgi:hypothetical protein